MRTLLALVIVSTFLSACGERFRGDFVGTAFAQGGDCGLDVGDAEYDIRVAGSISSNRASLRIIELRPQGSGTYSSGPAYKFAQLFRGFEIKADVINKETIQSEGKDTIYPVSDATNLDLENIDDEGRYITEPTDQFDIVTTTGVVNRARDQVSNLEVSRYTKLYTTAGASNEPCTFTLYIPQMILEK